MSESNRVRLSYAEESAWNTVPAVSFKDLRRTGGTFNQSQDTTESQEVRSDRMTADVIRTGSQVDGSIDVELSYGVFDDLYEGAMFDDWSAGDSVTGSLTTVASPTNTVTLTGAFVNAVVGDWFTISDANSDNGTFQIKTRTSDDEVVVEDWHTLVGESATAGVTIDLHQRVRNGTTDHSYSFEEAFLDITEFFVFSGCRMDTLELTVAVDQLVTGGFGVVGAGFDNGTSAFGTGANTAAPSGSVLNAVDHISDIREGAALASSMELTQIQFSLTNNLRANRAIGSLEPVAIKSGTFGLTGNLSAYFADSSLVTKYKDFTTSGISFRATDAAGDAYIFDIPAIKFTGDLPDPGGLDSDVMQSLNFTSFRHATKGYMFQIVRIPAA